MLPKLTALLLYATLSSSVGLNCGITSGTILAAVKAAFAWARAFALALAQVCLASRVAAGMAAAEAEASKVKSDKSCMIMDGQAELLQVRPRCFRAEGMQVATRRTPQFLYPEQSKKRTVGTMMATCRTENSPRPAKPGRSTDEMC